MDRTGFATPLHRKRRSFVLVMVGVAAFGAARGEAGFIAVQPIHGQDEFDVLQLPAETDQGEVRAPIYNDPAAMISGGDSRFSIEASRQLLLTRRADSGCREESAAFKLTDPWTSGNSWTPDWTSSASGKYDAQGDDAGQSATKAANSDPDGGRAGAIPLPDAAWSGLSCLAAVTLIGGLRRLRRRL